MGARGSERREDGSQGVDDDVTLPPDGTTVVVSDWRRGFLWLPVIVYSFVGLGGLLHFLSKDTTAIGLAFPLIYALGVAAFVRIARMGLILGPDGAKARAFVRTRSWRWDEIAGFELRPGSMPRLTVNLRDGESVGVYGFYAGSRKEQERAESLLVALESRRKAEMA
jgi:hypothetical protein